VDEYLSIEGGGWVRWIGSPAEASGFGIPAIRVRFAEFNGRLVPVEVNVKNEPAGLSADVFRRVPLGRLERWVNRSDLAGLVTGDAPTTEERRPVSPRIAVPQRQGRKAYPDVFYRRVAAAVSYGHSTRVIAERSGVPESTVNRWIKGARERGFLAPSRHEEGRR